MDHDERHEHLIKEFAEIYEPVLKNSPQAIYIYLDDVHKICNQKFADLMGYSSISEWVKNEAPLADIEESDQDSVIEAYTKASENMEASTLSATGVKQNASKINIEIIMVPFAYKDEVFVIHFISENNS